MLLFTFRFARPHKDALPIYLSSRVCFTQVISQPNYITVYLALYAAYNDNGTIIMIYNHLYTDVPNLDTTNHPHPPSPLSLSLYLSLSLPLSFRLSLSLSLSLSICLSLFLTLYLFLGLSLSLFLSLSSSLSTYLSPSISLFSETPTLPFPSRESRLITY